MLNLTGILYVTTSMYIASDYEYTVQGSFDKFNYGAQYDNCNMCIKK